MILRVTVIMESLSAKASRCTCDLRFNRFQCLLLANVEDGTSIILALHVALVFVVKIGARKEHQSSHIKNRYNVRTVNAIYKRY